MTAGQPIPCCGRPHVDDLNSCSREATHLVVGTQLPAQGLEPVLLVLTCCGEHLAAVRRFQAQYEDALVAPIDALPLVLDDLGSDAWVAASEAV